jgi:hypothetical protein
MTILLVILLFFILPLINGVLNVIIKIIEGIISLGWFLVKLSIPIFIVYLLYVGCN